MPLYKHTTNSGLAEQTLVYLTGTLVDSTPQINPTKQTKDSEMSDTLATERCYLSDRIFEIADNKNVDARKKYGYVDDAAPKNVEELTQRLKDGKYVVHSDYKDGRYPCIRWRDHSVKEDPEGFIAFQNRFSAARQNAMDAVNILPPVEALKILQELAAFEV